MLYYPEAEKGKRVPVQIVEGREFEGLGIQKEQVIKHIRELRSLVYQILNVLVMGNGRTTLLLITSLSSTLHQQLY